MTVYEKNRKKHIMRDNPQALTPLLRATERTKLMNNDQKIDMKKHYAELEKMFETLNNSGNSDNKIFQLTRICEKLFKTLEDQNTISCCGFLHNKGRISRLERRINSLEKRVGFTYKKAS